MANPPSNPPSRRAPRQEPQPSDAVTGPTGPTGPAGPLGLTRLNDIRPSDDAPPPRQRSGRPFVLLAVLLLGAAAAWWWWKSQVPEGAQAAAPAAASAPSPVVAAPASAPAPVVTAPQPPTMAPEPEPKAGAVVLSSDADIRTALTDLLSAKTVSTWLQLDEFPRRVVSTVDNLAREHAALRLWPVFPTVGRFSVNDDQGRKTVHPDNVKRYAPMVQAFESIDNAAVAALYVRMLPTLQRAYVDLGFPQRRFHTRLLEVIDHLLAAPAPNETQVRGEVPSTRPWVRYEFADPALESASAGHKMMLRMGAAHQRRVKTKLKALRAALVEQAKT
jgi:Protein of unknown function (DUF3014)